MEVTAWLSKTLVISGLFPLRTLATQNLLETHIPTLHSQKKNLVTCHFESVSGALPKKEDERAVLKEQESLYTRRETVPVYIRAPKLSYKSYLVSARSTPGILLPVKQEDLYPSSPTLFHVPGLSACSKTKMSTRQGKDT